jgi:hypothetical protein
MPWRIALKHKCKRNVYIKVHASNALSSALSAEIKDEIEMEHCLLERANLLWKLLEQMYDSSNSKRSSSSAPENISSSSTHFDQDQEEQSSVQKEELNSVSLGKLDSPISQTVVSSFGRTENVLAEEDDCYTSSFDIDDEKLISKHMKLQKRHEDLLYSHKELIDSYALLESTPEVMVTKVKDSQPHTCTCAPPFINLSCANSCCSQAKPSCDEHVLVKTCDSFIASENDELKRENKILKMELN